MAEQAKNQLSLLSFGGLEDAVNKVFKHSPITAKGKDVGVAYVLGSRKVVAENLGLQPKKDKEELDRIMLETQDKMWQHVRGQVSALNGDWTLHKAATRTVGDGVKQITVVLREIKRKKHQWSDEQALKFWNEHCARQGAEGMTMEQFLEARARQEAAEAGIDVKAEVVPPAQIPAQAGS